MSEDDRTALLKNFRDALAALTTSAVEALTDENKVMLVQALTTGAGHIRLIVIPSPLIIIGALHHTVDRTVKPQVLFRIDDDLESGDFH